MNSVFIRTLCGTTESFTWTNVMHCARNELFRVMAVSISKCVQQKLSMEPTFKMEDIGQEAADDVIDRLKVKQTINNKEIHYLKALIQRAYDYQQNRSNLSNYVISTVSKWAKHKVLRLTVNEESVS